MKLIRLKITGSKGFRSLQCGFEHVFRNKIVLNEKPNQPSDFEPFICAGRNGSGKSNLLEALAAIFYQMEIQRVSRNFLPEALRETEPETESNMEASRAVRIESIPEAFELEYLIKLEQPVESLQPYAHVKIIKEQGQSPRLYWLNAKKCGALREDCMEDGYASAQSRDFLLPKYVIGYSSGENEILSLPFFKMRFVQFDEYWYHLQEKIRYPGYPDTRMVYLDGSFSQAILLCNLLFEEPETLKPFEEDVGIKELNTFRIIIKCVIPATDEIVRNFNVVDDGSVPILSYSEEPGKLGDLKIVYWLQHQGEGERKADPLIERLQRCATSSFYDKDTDLLVLDYWVNEATREAFKKNFGTSLDLFQSLQVLLTLNLFSVSEKLKEDVYQSGSHYVRETIPILASDERIIRFKFVYFTKQGIDEPVMLKNLSDGEHQFLHSLGMCLLFRNENALFLLDEPETHFNPDWRANFISRLRDCMSRKSKADTDQEMLITTHTPFLISDSRPEKVFVFSKDESTGNVSISTPDYNTQGASINRITAETFEKKETIGAHANDILQSLLNERETTGDIEGLIERVMHTIGDSVERTLAVKALLDFEKGHNLPRREG